MSLVRVDFGFIDLQFMCGKKIYCDSFLCRKFFEIILEIVNNNDQFCDFYIKYIFLMYFIFFI